MLDFNDNDDAPATVALGDEVAAAAAVADRSSIGTARCSNETCTRAIASRD